VHPGAHFYWIWLLTPRLRIFYDISLSRTTSSQGAASDVPVLNGFQLDCNETSGMVNWTG